MPATLKSLTRHIAYLDILGFRDLLRQNNFEEKIAGIVEILEDRTGFDRDHHPYLKYLAISDTIVITATETHAPDLLWKVTQVQSELLKLGFCLRGGISFGKLLIYDNGPIQNIFGPTFVAAYTLESERAFYPRVVIEETLVEKIEREFLDRSKDTSGKFILQDADGVYFVNQFARDLIEFERSKQNKAISNKKLFLKRINESFGLADTKSKMKWHWLKGQHKTQYRKIQ